MLQARAGVERWLDRKEQEAEGVNQPRSGDLLVWAEEGAWFAYPWWSKDSESPDFASHVDIHNKPGYDPCELFFGWPPMSVSRDTNRIKGIHGRTGKNRRVAWASTFSLESEPTTLLELALSVKERLVASV